MRTSRAAIAIWLLALAASAAILVRTPFRTDMAAFLPSHAPLAEQVLTAQAASGAASHLLLAALSSAPAPVLAKLSEAMAVKLRAEPEFIDVMNGDSASFAGLRKFIWHNRYLLSPQMRPAGFTEAGLHAALENDLGLLASEAGGFAAQTVTADPTGEMLALLPRLTPRAGPAMQDGVWFSPGGKLALLLIHSRAPGFDLDGQQRAQGLIRAAFARARGEISGGGSARLRMTGPGVFAVHTRNITRTDVIHLSLLASAGAITLLASVYRSPLVLLLGILPVATGALVAAAAVSLAFGFVHGITLGFGVTLIGESLDYAIYLFTQTAGGGAEATLTRIWPTLRLGALTSMAGFAAMVFSDFTGFAQLGLFSLTGLLASAGVTRFILPGLVPARFSAASGLAWPVRQITRFRRGLRVVLVLVLAGAGIALALHRGGLWDRNLNDLSPIPAADARLDTTLRQDMGLSNIRYFAVLRAANVQQALRRSETLAGLLRPLVAAGQLGGFDVPSTILPPRSTQAARRAALPEPAVLKQRLTAAMAGLPFKPGAFAPFLQDAAQAKAGGLIGRQDLPPPLRLKLDSMLAQAAGGWVVMAPLHGVSDAQAVAAALKAAHLPWLGFVDLNAESASLLGRFQQEAVTLALVGSSAILLLLLAGLRSVGRVVTVAAPLACAVLITLAVLTLNGGHISIFMVVGLLLIVAVGSNYCLFFERAEPDPVLRRHEVASVVLANLCTVSAYGLMALSRIPVLHDIGMTVALGTFLSLIIAALLNREVLPC